MVERLRRFFDVRHGEGLPVLLSFLYIAVVVAAFLLAKPIRNSLFLREYGPYALVYVYAAVPVALTIFVPLYSRVVARFGSRAVTVGTLVFFSANVLVFWYVFRSLGTGSGEAAEAPRQGLLWLMPAVFYVWVNCFGVIAPVQAWMYANSLFDTRQAKRLFGIIGAGASLGAIAGGALARFLVEPVGGTVNMMLVLAVLILLAAGIVIVANLRIRRRGSLRAARPGRQAFRESLRQIRGSRYLRLMASVVFLVAIVTQWIAFQLSLLADAQFAGDADRLTRFFGTFNFTLGAVTFVLQLLVTGPALRRFGIGATILLLPLALGAGSALILALPVFWTVLLTNGLDQGLRFSVDKATYELLYLPLPPAQRAAVKSTIDIVFNRFADGVGAFLLGLATQGFFFVPGLELGLYGTAAINLLFIALWCALAWQVRREYVRTIQDTIHRHRIDSERMAAGPLDALTSGVVRQKLLAADPEEVRDALNLVELRPVRSWLPALRDLLKHPAADVRARALAILNSAGDKLVGEEARALLRDRDIGVRTEALLYLSRVGGLDPVQEIERLGDFQDFSIRAGMVAFLGAPGPSQNLDAARALLDPMVRASGSDAARERQEAARLLGRLPESFHDFFEPLIADEEVFVARQAIHSAARIASDRLIDPLMRALARPEVADDAAEALARYGNGMVRDAGERMSDESVSPEVRRELPQVLVRIGSPEAEEVLVESLLQKDVTLRHNVIVALNKLQAIHPRLRIDPGLVEVVLAAEIAGHYRSYQVLGPLRAQLKEEDAILQALRHAMEQELERIFRLMKLLFPTIALHDAYVGVRSRNPLVRANALEFLENVLKPELRQVLVPLLDSQVSEDERIAMADRLVGAPLESSEQAVATLLASEDAWLRSRAAYAVGALRLHGLAPELRKLESNAEPVVKEAIGAAMERLGGETPPEQVRPLPPEMNVSVGAG
jgi:AAA family ATP:ADP antiporter